MDSNYIEQRRWSDKFIPAIKKIIGQYLLVPSSFEEDTQHACDLIIMKARDMRIAARIRKYHYSLSYGDEFTIRCKTQYNQKTEIHKIIEGWGDWFFYGFANETEEDISKWFLIDLHVLRRNRLQKQPVKTGVQDNFDQTGFRWFKIWSFTPDILIASSQPIDFLAYQQAQIPA